MGKPVDSSQFDSELKDILNSYSLEVQASLAEAVKESAKQTVKTLKSKAKAAYPNAKNYSKSFSSKVTTELHGVTAQIYSPKYYYLAHLLENEHAQFHWGRAAGTFTPNKHWEPTEQAAEDDLMERVQKGIQEL